MLHWIQQLASGSFAFDTCSEGRCKGSEISESDHQRPVMWPIVGIETILTDMPAMRSTKQW
jgi:hypothetical protein